MQGFQTLLTWNNRTYYFFNFCKKNVQIQQATPPSFYIKKNYVLTCELQQFVKQQKEALDSWSVQYMSICDSDKEQAELIVTMGHTIQNNPRTKG